MMLKLLLSPLDRGHQLAGDGTALPCRRGLPLAQCEHGSGLPLDLSLSAPPPRRHRRPLRPGAGPVRRSRAGAPRPRRPRRHQAAASASKHKAMSYDRMGPRIEELEAEVAAMLAEAEAADAAEDAAFGEDKRVTRSQQSWRPRSVAWPSCAPPRSPSRPRRGRGQRKRPRKRPPKAVSARKRSKPPVPQRPRARRVGTAQRTSPTPSHG